MAEGQQPPPPVAPVPPVPTPISSRLEEAINSELSSRFGNQEQQRCRIVIDQIKQALSVKQKILPELDSLFHLGNEPRDPEKQLQLMSSILHPGKLEALLHILQTDPGTPQDVHQPPQQRQGISGRQQNAGPRPAPAVNPEPVVGGPPAVNPEPVVGGPPIVNPSLPAAAGTLPAPGTLPPPAGTLPASAVNLEPVVDGPPAVNPALPAPTVTLPGPAGSLPAPAALSAPAVDPEPIVGGPPVVDPEPVVGGPPVVHPEPVVVGNQQQAGNQQLDDNVVDNQQLDDDNQQHDDNVVDNQQDDDKVIDNQQVGGNANDYDGFEIHGLTREGFNRFTMRFKAVKDLTLREYMCILRNRGSFDVRDAPMPHLKEGVVLYHVPPLLNQGIVVSDDEADGHQWNLQRSYSGQVMQESVRYTKYQCQEDTHWTKKVYRTGSVDEWVVVHYRFSGDVPTVNSMTRCVNTLRQSFDQFRAEDNTICGQMMDAL